AAGLLGMLAEVLMQGVVQDVGGRVRPADRLASRGVDAGLGMGADLDGAVVDPADVEDEAAVALGVLDVEAEVGPLDDADVADLAAGLAVEGRAVEHQGDRLAVAGGLAVDEPPLRDD